MILSRIHIKDLLLSIALCLFFIPFSYSQVNTNMPGACGFAQKNASTTPVPLTNFSQSFNQSACGLNYVAATHIVETRYDPYTVAGNYGCPLPCAWSVSGMSPCIAPVKALVWASVSYTEASPPVGTISITNPLGNTTSYSAGAVGTSVSKCWGETGTATYRWDVTTCVGGNGSYTFNFSGFSNPLFEIDGATIFIVYRDLNATYDGSLIFWDGALATSAINGTVSQTLGGFNVCATPSSATAFMITSDHQDNSGGNAHNSQMNGVVYSFPNSFSNFQVKPTSLVAGQTTSAFYDSNNGSGDCFLWSMAGLYYQSNCTSCTPTGLAGTQSSTPSSCGGNTGTATVNPSGGIIPYTYSWSPAVAGNTNTAGGLAPGNYTVTVFDATGCSTPVIITVNGASAPSVTASSTQAGCTVANGSATASATGGTGAYTYLWSPSSQITQTATGLASGTTYTILVTDANGCTNTDTLTIGATASPIATATSTQTGCTVANGTATINPSGGTPGYTYVWSPSGGNAQTATGLIAGDYTATITDANGCSTITTVSVSTTNNIPSVAASTVNNVSCFNGTNGSASATPSGGTPNYTYAWLPSGGNSSAASNLSAGNYSVTITDANGCSATNTVSITQPSVLSATQSQINVNCNAGNNASATVTPAGGTAPYTYSWNTSPVQNTQTASNLIAGSYQCTVTDSHGCTTTVPFTITQPTALALSSTHVNVLCNGGNNGNATATTSGGTSPYTYAWNTSPVQNTQTASNLSAGNYTVTVTDSHGCTKQSPVTITQPAALTYSVNGNDSICKGTYTLLAASANGGTPAYTYVWNPGPHSGTSFSVNPSTSTIYTVSITDANGCASSNQTFNVHVLPSPNALFDTASTGMYGSLFAFTDLSTPSVTITSWHWNFGDGSSGSTQQNPIHTFPGAGTYTVTEVAYNQFGCPDTFLLSVIIGEGILIPNVFTPDGNGQNDVWYIPNSGMKEFHVEIFDRWGAKVWQATADEIRWDGHSSAGKLLSDGTYYFVLHAILKSGAKGKDYSTTGYVTLLTNKK